MRATVLSVGLLHKTNMLANGVCTAMSSSSTKLDYEEAVMTLNSLQTNAALLKQYKRNGIRSQQAQAENVAETKKYLIRSGISLNKLDQLSVLHVAGTKGKGSTCAFCESILRHHGFKTGFFSSPHLVEVRERIRINGHPISKQNFSMYFFEVYNKLNTKKEDKNDMPPYFKFLTIMAFYTFLAEKVDVAIVEVGIGGEYDCTNVLRQVKAVGITSLGIDHTSLLGATIPEIAWQKAGIMKAGCVAFTSNGQSEAAMSVLSARAAEKQCPLLIAPPLESYNWGPFRPELGVKCEVQKVNASLALQLANFWIQQHDLIKLNCSMSHGMKLQTNLAPTFPITSPMALGLKHCYWPGRTQIIKKERIKYFLDGAHTAESMAVCAKWFYQASKLNHFTRDRLKRALIFNATGFRDSARLLELLLSCNFHLVIFCPNIVTTTVNATSDQANFMVTEKEVLLQCEKHKEAWLNLQHSISSESKDLILMDSIKVLPCVYDALSVIEREEGELEVLVTGSLHLVGAVLSILDPELSRTINCPLD